MMRSIFFAALIFMAGSAWAGSVICYDLKNGFASDPPSEWKPDFATAKKSDLCIVYIPKSVSEFEKTPVFIYPRVLPSKDQNTGSSGLQAFIKEDVEEYKKHSPKGEVATGADIQSIQGINFKIRRFLNGEAPNEFETAAYGEVKGSIFLGVLSAHTKADLDKYEADFKAFLNSVSQTSKANIYNAIRKAADAAVKIADGKTFETTFLSAIGQKLAESMKTCVQKGDKGFSSVITVGEDGAINEWTNKVDNHLGLCMRDKMKGLVSDAKPPGAPFYLPLDMKLKK